MIDEAVLLVSLDGSVCRTNRYDPEKDGYSKCLINQESQKCFINKQAQAKSYLEALKSIPYIDTDNAILFDAWYRNASNRETSGSILTIKGQYIVTLTINQRKIQYKLNGYFGDCPKFDRLNTEMISFSHNLDPLIKLHDLMTIYYAPIKKLMEMKTKPGDWMDRDDQVFAVQTVPINTQWMIEDGKLYLKSNNLVKVYQIVLENDFYRCDLIYQTNRDSM